MAKGKGLYLGRHVGKLTHAIFELAIYLYVRLPTSLVFNLMYVAALDVCVLNTFGGGSKLLYLLRSLDNLRATPDGTETD